MGSLMQDEPAAKRPKPGLAPELRVDALEFDLPIPAHAPELYRPTEGWKVNRVEEGGLPAVSDAHANEFGQQGYVVVEDALSGSEVDSILQALREVVQSEDFRSRAGQTTALQAAGTKDLALGGCNPVLQFEAFARGMQGEGLYRLENVRKLMGFHEIHPRIEALASDPALLGVVRRLLTEAGCSASDLEHIDVYQSLALVKPPGGREKPWHQDNAYFNVDWSKVKMVGVWIALTEVTTDNGAMHVLPAPLSELRPMTHFQRRDWQICDKDVLNGGRRCLAVPLHPGGALFFSTMLPHGTPTNTSDSTRYAIQFHFIPRSFAARCGTAERQSIWGEGGKEGASC
mmetsp:Transcript_28553/g.59322  ORF Transcript_28553/g.59322 Transcript_28553/m.59322 type:complete len:344 (-) Transcript_28553:316-1347(-)